MGLTQKEKEIAERNDALVLTCLQAGDLIRPVICQKTGLARSTVHGAIKRLEKRGLVSRKTMPYPESNAGMKAPYEKIGRPNVIFFMTDKELFCPICDAFWHKTTFGFEYDYFPKNPNWKEWVKCPNCNQKRD